MAKRGKNASDHGAARPPTPPRVGPLRTLRDVQTELARVYRQARTGKLGLDEAKGLGYLLQLLATITKDATLEARVAVLEGRLNALPTDQSA